MNPDSTLEVGNKLKERSEDQVEIDGLVGEFLKSVIQKVNSDGFTFTKEITDPKSTKNSDHSMRNMLLVLKDSDGKRIDIEVAGSEYHYTKPYKTEGRSLELEATEETDEVRDGRRLRQGVMINRSTYVEDSVPHEPRQDLHIFGPSGTLAKGTLSEDEAKSILERFTNAQVDPQATQILFQQKEAKMRNQNGTEFSTITGVYWNRDRQDLLLSE